MRQNPFWKTRVKFRVGHFYPLRFAYDIIPYLRADCKRCFCIHKKNFSGYFTKAEFYGIMIRYDVTRQVDLWAILYTEPLARSHGWWEEWSHEMSPVRLSWEQGHCRLYKQYLVMKHLCFLWCLHFRLMCLFTPKVWRFYVRKENPVLCRYLNNPP